MLNISKLMTIIAGILIAENAIANSYYVNCTEQNGCIQEIQKTIDEYRENNKLTGIQMSISLPDKKSGYQPILTFVSGYTTKDQTHSVGALTLMQPNKKMDLFGDGSITKSFTAAIILQLEAEGKLNLDDSIKKYLPQYKDWRDITIRQLLNMTSGIFDYTESQDFLQQEVYASEKQWTLQELVELSYNNTQKTIECPPGGNLCFIPGTSWMYSSTNYILAQLIIEAVTGHNFRDVINQRLIGMNSKLGQLKNTYYFDSTKSYDPHFFPINIWQRAVHSYYPLQSIIDPTGDYPEDDTTDMNLSYASAAGANISNSEDILKWTRLLFQTNQVLHPAQENELNSFICTGRVCDRQGKYCHKSPLYGQPIKKLSAECNAGFGLGVGEVINDSDGRERSFDGTMFGYNSFYVLFEKYDIDISAQGDGVNSIDPLPFKILPILKKFHVYK